MFDKLECDVQYNFNLAPITSWKIGGDCKVYITPKTEENIIQVKNICLENDIPLLVIGNGSNILKSNEYYNGVVLHTAKALDYIDISDERITVGSGCMLPKMAFHLAKHSIGSYAFYAGIPGTVGGAIVMNAGSAGQETKDVLESVTYLNEDGRIITEKVNEIGLTFRKSKFLDRNVIILSATFKIFPEDKELALKKTKEIAERRRKKFPLNLPTAGSTFKSPSDGPYPGKLIEEAGLKGYRVGGAQISELHGNWIINNGHATSTDVNQLIDYIQKEVYDKFGITLEKEIIFL